MDQGCSVVTLKFIQTGNTGQSEDILLHRRLIGTGPLPEDAEGLTAPLIFSYPASAQLAARMDGRQIDLTVVDRARNTLAERYDWVLTEGAGGLMVPITDTMTTVDYIASRELPAALVTTSRLGSINHTLLSLEALRSRGIAVPYILYNHFDDERAGAPIAQDTRQYLQRMVERQMPHTQILDVPVFTDTQQSHT